MIFYWNAGIVFTYGLAQLGLFVLFHAGGLCWGVAFPFHFRRFKAQKQIKYIHITTIIATLFLPLVPALLHLDEGYGVANTPSTVCFGRNVAVTYFTLILPLSVILAIATSILVIMFWIIFKVNLPKPNIRCDTMSYRYYDTVFFSCLILELDHEEVFSNFKE